MLLFAGAFGTILHSGDVRLDHRYLNLLPQRVQQQGAIDLLYLDCTFGAVPQVKEVHAYVLS